MFVIISAERTVDSTGTRVEAVTNDRATKALRRALTAHGFDFEEVQGVYKGVSEKSFKVNKVNSKQVRVLRYFAHIHSQESIFVGAGYKEETGALLPINDKIISKAEYGSASIGSIYHSRTKPSLADSYTKLADGSYLFTQYAD